MNKNSIGCVNTLTSKAKYQSDPLSVYHLLCHEKSHSILLESAEIDKKHLLKSLLLTDAAVKIVCNGNTVRFTPLSLNGKAAVDYAARQLAEQANLSYQADSSLIAKFPEVATELDEKARLMAKNPFESLRLFNHLKNIDNHPFAVFLGGVFAFDMISISENLPKVPDGENTCSDFVYYLAETLVIIDHELASTEIIANVFTGPEQQQCTEQMKQRVVEIKEQLQQPITSEQIDSAVTSNTANKANKANKAKKENIA